MAKPVADFYDRLSPEYRHNMGWDWEAVMREEGVTLNRFLEDRMDRPGPYTLLDCSCGIGTQAIGLALQRHQVHATDLSTVSIDCARKEAENLGVEMSFGVADYRALGETVSDTFDVVLTCDNSIAHCLKDEDLDAALASMKSRLNPDGILLISLRDYDALVMDKPRFNNEHVQDRPDVPSNSILYSRFGVVTTTSPGRASPNSDSSSADSRGGSICSITSTRVAASNPCHRQAAKCAL